MQCRVNCGACCIAPSISSVIPLHSFGKPAGVRCLHLDNENKCSIFLDPAFRPPPELKHHTLIDFLSFSYIR